MATPRFEVRSCKSGFIQSVCATFEHARAYADGYRAEVGDDDRFFIVDTALPLATGDDRIVWREGDLRPTAVEWLRSHGGSVT
jgi:hypothetical protein